MAVSRGSFGKGFALPSVLIASVVAMMVLMAALSSTAGIQSSLSQQYYDKLAREAAESGTAMAEECLERNNYVVTWTNAKPLTPKTNCDGDPVTTYPENLLDEPNLKVSFSVKAPTNSSDNKFLIVSQGITKLVRESDGGEWRTFLYDGRSLVGGQISFRTLAFGYTIAGGSFFGTVYPDGRVAAVGANSYGQLGNGTTTASTQLTFFDLPNGEKGSSIYSSYLSLGRGMFVITEKGDLYGAGKNSYGELGNTPIIDARSAPLKFNLPAGVKAKFVSMLIDSTFVLGDDNNIYAAGRCASGQLGINNSGCSYQSTPQRVLLPTPSTNNLNTIPDPVSRNIQADNIVADRASVFIRMKGGAVYGWGNNDYGQLGNGTTTSQDTPVKVGPFGDNSAPRATQLAFDGNTLYILTDRGTLFVAGESASGQLMGAPVRIKRKSNTSQCLTQMGAGENYTVQACATDNASQLFKLRPDGRVETAGLCIERYIGGTTDGTIIARGSCESTFIERQDWELRPDGKFFNSHTNKCIDLASDNKAQLWSCSAARAAGQEWVLDVATGVTAVPLPSGTKALRVTTDQRSALVLLDNGEVWGAGANDSGQLGIGGASSAVTRLKKMALPSGRTAVDVYTAMAGSHESSNQYSNTFVVLDNGSVVGTGSNQLGTLGIGTMGGYHTTPQLMSLPAGIRAKSVQTGLGTTIILTESGQIYTVGNNANGQLGDGTTVNRSVPKASQYTNDTPAVLF